MAKIDEIREDISLTSRLLMMSIGTVVVTVGGTVSLGLAEENWGIFSIGFVATFALSVICSSLLRRVRRFIRQLGEL